MELKDIKFTKEEFDLLIKGVEGLPDQDTAGDLMTGLIECMLTDKIPPELMAKREREKAMKEKAKKMEKETLKENCWILQAKLVQLRRYLEQNKLLAEAQDIING
jgi:hypothetical protein